MGVNTSRNYHNINTSNFKAWKTRIDLILAKNKVLNLVRGKIMKPQFEAGKEKEP
jgi:hypothetical protein